MNIKPSDEDDFLLIKKYRFIPSFTVPSKTIIELEIHKNNICIVSFYSHNKGTEKNKYKIRHNYNIGHVKAIFKACLEVFYSLGLHQYAFIFNATNDIGKNEEYNSRYSSYLRFLELYYQNYDICHKKGSTTLNTYMIYHPNYQYKKEADVFYLDFEKKIDLENQGFEIDK